MVVLTTQKVGLIYKPQVLAITLSLVIALGLLLQCLDLGSFLLDISQLLSIPDAFADHGEEIVLSLNDSSFAQKSLEEGNQVKVIVNYATQEPMAVHDLVKGVMKVYSPNGTLLKTSSSPTPFPVSISGKTQLVTTLTDNSQESVTAKIIFTNPIRTETVSNELLVKIDLIKGLARTPQDEKQIETEAVQEEKPAMTSPIPAQNKDVTEQPPVQHPAVAPPQEEELVAPALEDEKQTETEAVQEEKPAMTSPIPAQNKDVTERHPIAPTGPLFPGAPQAFTSGTASHSAMENCGDGVDDDADALIDFKDGDCIAITSRSSQLLQEEQLMAGASIEVCDDTLDNDLDAKIDSEDEECASTTSLNQQLGSNSQEGQERETSINDEQPQSDEGDVDDDTNSED